MLRCDLCGSTVDSAETAITLDWNPSYFFPSGEECYKPVCGECSLSKLDYDFVYHPPETVRLALCTHRD